MYGILYTFKGETKTTLIRYTAAQAAKLLKSFNGFAEFAVMVKSDSPQLNERKSK